MYLLVFIQYLLVHFAEKILLVQPDTFVGDCLSQDESLTEFVKQNRHWH